MLLAHTTWNACVAFLFYCRALLPSFFLLCFALGVGACRASATQFWGSAGFGKTQFRYHPVSQNPILVPPVSQNQILLKPGLLKPGFCAGFLLKPGAKARFEKGIVEPRIPRTENSWKKIPWGISGNWDESPHE